MARTKKAATKTTVKTASISETPAKSVVTASEEKAVKAETPKTDDAKASVETKAAEKTATRKTAAAKKTTTRTTAKTTAAKTTRKTAAKKAEPVTEVYVQYWGKEIHTSEVADKIKKIWTEDMGKKAPELKDLKIYIKPEDNGAHYVINGDVAGFIGL